MTNHDLSALLADPAATFCCLGEDGTTASVHASLERSNAQVLLTDPALDAFAASSHGEVVAAFVGCLTSGRVTTAAALATGENRRVELFDERGTIGCVVMVLSPTNEALPEQRAAAAALPLRRCTSHMDASGQVLRVDDGYEQLTGYAAADVVGNNSSLIVHPDDLLRSQLSFAEVLQRPGGQTRIRLRIQHRDGDWRWVEITRTNLLHTDEPHIFNEVFDLTAEMEVQTNLQQREALLTRLTEALPLGVLHFSREGAIDLANERWAEMTGATPDGDLRSVIISAFEAPESILALLQVVAPDDTHVSIPVHFSSPTLGKRNGLLRQLPVVQNATGPMNATAEERGPASVEIDRGVLLTLEDTTETIDFQRELGRLARTDHLTQSLNRLGVEEQIEELLIASRADRHPIQLLYFDLNDFKAINDSLGHAVGDEVLQELAASIRGAVRPEDTIGRLGGDEFVAVVRDLPGEQVEKIAHRVNAHLAETHGVSVAVGIATARNADDFDSLVSRADRRMYRAKDTRRP